MGRELKRVPLDFAWPVGKVWRGYLNPHPEAAVCPACDGSGLPPEARLLTDQWYGNAPFQPSDRGSEPLTAASLAVRAFAERNVRLDPGFFGTGSKAIEREAERLCQLLNGMWCYHLNDDDVTALIDNDRLRDVASFWSADGDRVTIDPPRRPSAREVNLWSITHGCHDRISRYIVVEAECKRRGIALHCASCDGDGEIWPSAQAQKTYESWEPEPPPVGEAYQIWETVSEGSPISPPFATAEELAQFMCTTRWGADKGTSFAVWLEFIRGPGWAPSLVIDAHGVRDGVSASVPTLNAEP